MADNSKSTFAKHVRAAKPRAKKYDVSRLGVLGAGGGVIVPAAVAASPAQPVLPLADHGVRLSATARR